MTQSTTALHEPKGSGREFVPWKVISRLPKNLRRIQFSSFLGTAIEYYDFYLVCDRCSDRLQPDLS